eukprot:TRINITY_DN2962_c0_g2_i1.p5 TRINITY_DN2962_c0_g2~~TRINITY_DN2962_c0_g2_i1.p5  ORF type:complete len:112 (-),score=1.70 TRINITY_DN2962_c0_g2_i1:1603-1938(-)
MSLVTSNYAAYSIVIMNRNKAKIISKHDKMQQPTINTIIDITNAATNRFSKQQDIADCVRASLDKELGGKWSVIWWKKRNDWLGCSISYCSNNTITFEMAGLVFKVFQSSK